MRFVSESPAAEFVEEPTVGQVIEALQRINCLQPNAVVSVGLPVGADRYEPKPLASLRELLVNRHTQVVFVPRNSHSPAETLARAILTAAQIHEDSFDVEAANKATQRQCKTGLGFVDYSRFYTLTIHDACQRIEPSSLRVPVYTMLSLAWNDALDWAKATANAHCSLDGLTKGKKK